MVGPLTLLRRLFMRSDFHRLVVSCPECNAVERPQEKTHQFECPRCGIAVSLWDLRKVSRPPLPPDQRQHGPLRLEDSWWQMNRKTYPSS